VNAKQIKKSLAEWDAFGERCQVKPEATAASKPKRNKAKKGSK